MKRQINDAVLNKEALHVSALVTGKTCFIMHSRSNDQTMESNSESIFVTITNNQQYGNVPKELLLCSLRYRDRSEKQPSPPFFFWSSTKGSTSKEQTTNSANSDSGVSRQRGFVIVSCSNQVCWISIPACSHLQGLVRSSVLKNHSKYKSYHWELEDAK